MTTLTISADSHITEPAETYIDFIDPAYAARAPRLEDCGPEIGDAFVIDGFHKPVSLGTIAAAGKAAEEIKLRGSRFADLHRGGWDPEARLADQDRDGVAAEVIYPSIGMILCNHPDLDYKKACFDAYNRWMAGYCAAHPDRLLGLGQTAMRTPDEGIADLKAMKGLGLRGVMMPGQPGVEDYDSPVYDEFWAATVALEMVPSFHILTMRAERTRGPKMNSFLSIVRGCQDVFGMLVLGGVFERNPDVKVVCAEADAGWVPHFMYRLDHAYNRHRNWLPPGQDLTHPPSHYFASNIYVTFQDDWTAFRFADDMNWRHLLWANDFPHSDSTWPWSQELLEQHTAQLSAEQKDAILYGNVADLYGIAVSAPGVTPEPTSPGPVEFWLAGGGAIGPGRTAASARRAEDEGWDGLALVDSQNLAPDPYIHLGLAAAATERLKLATGVTNPLTRHPATAAAAISTVQAESGGRAVLGIGRGDSSLAHLGLAPASPAGFERYLIRLQGYLRGDEVPFERADGQGLAPPASELGLAGGPEVSRLRWVGLAGPKVPVDVAATGPTVIGVAARQGERITFAVGSDPGRVRWAIGVAEAAAAAAGRDEAAMGLGAYVPVVVHPDPRAARTLISGGVASFARFSVMHGTVAGPADETRRAALQLVHDTYDMNRHFSHGSPQSQDLPDDVVDAFGIAGPPEYCSKRLIELIGLGLTKLVLLGGGIGMDRDAARQSRELLSREVLPAVRSSVQSP